MTQFYYDPRFRCWLIKCCRCLSWKVYVYETPDGDRCHSCLRLEQPRRAA